jgi:hypothetical protein
MTREDARLAVSALTLCKSDSVRRSAELVLGFYLNGLIEGALAVDAAQKIARGQSS